MATTPLEERVATLEAEMAGLRARLPQTTSASQVPWWKKIVGVYKDDPEFEEAARLGREWRRSTHTDDAGDDKDAA